MNGQSVVGQQAATGFMETSFSLLTVNTSDLVNGVETFNCTATLDLSGADTNSCLNFDGSIYASVDVTAYCKYSRFLDRFLLLALLRESLGMRLHSTV